MTPQPAETTIVTQYGIERPDGQIIWGSFSPGNGSDHYLKDVHNHEDDRRKLENALTRIAQNIGIDPQGYLDAHQLVTRDVITITMGVQRGITLVAR